MANRITVTLTGTYRKCDPFIIEKLERLFTELGLILYFDTDKPKENVRVLEYGKGRKKGHFEL